MDYYYYLKEFLVLIQVNKFHYFLNPRATRFFFLFFLFSFLCNISFEIKTKKGKPERKKEREKERKKKKEKKGKGDHLKRPSFSQVADWSFMTSLSSRMERA